MDFAKKIAAQTAIRDYFLPLVNQNTPIIVGIGSGSTIEFGVIELASIVLQYPTLKVVCIPTSYQAKSLILQHSLVLASLDEYSKMHVCFDGADEVGFDISFSD
jgi:ribose 5-phosphate isomerase A